jgi:hypothetical protein
VRCATLPREGWDRYFCGSQHGRPYDTLLRVFSALRDPRDHHDFVEHDDARQDEAIDAT